VVSHDRWFLDRICTHILAFEGDSQARLFWATGAITKPTCSKPLEKTSSRTGSNTAR